MQKLEQLSPEWFALKAGKFSGSRFAELMARTRNGWGKSRENLIATLVAERMTGACVTTYSNAAMQRGTELEPEARSAYEAHAGVLVEEVAFIEHPTVPNVGVSPDGLVGDDGMVELKCPSAMDRHLQAILNKQHAKDYRWQLQGQLWVTGRAWVDAVSYDPRWPEPYHLAIERVEADPKAHQELAEAVAEAEQEIITIIQSLKEKSA